MIVAKLVFGQYRTHRSETRNANCSGLDRQCARSTHSSCTSTGTRAHSNPVIQDWPRSLVSLAAKTNRGSNMQPYKEQIESRLLRWVLQCCGTKRLCATVLQRITAQRALFRVHRMHHSNRCSNAFVRVSRAGVGLSIRLSARALSCNLKPSIP